MSQTRVKDGRKVMMGEITMNTYNGDENRLQLFDGKFTTGYRVVEFRIVPRAPVQVEEVVATLSTKPLGGVPSTYNFSFKSQVGFAWWGVPEQARYSEGGLIVDGNMIVEDLWIACYSTGDDYWCNYYIVLEKYEFPAWDGTAIIAENNM